MALNREPTDDPTPPPRLSPGSPVPPPSQGRAGPAVPHYPYRFAASVCWFRRKSAAQLAFWWECVSYSWVRCLQRQTPLVSCHLQVDRGNVMQVHTQNQSRRDPAAVRERALPCHRLSDLAPAKAGGSEICQTPDGSGPMPVYGLLSRPVVPRGVVCHARCLRPGRWPSCRPLSRSIRLTRSRSSCAGPSRSRPPAPTGSSAAPGAGPAGSWQSPGRPATTCPPACSPSWTTSSATPSPGCFIGAGDRGRA